MNKKIGLEKLDTEGYIVLEDILTTRQCRHFSSLLEQCVERYTPLSSSGNSISGHGLESKKNEKIVFNLHNKDFSFLELVDHPTVYPFLDGMLREGSYQNSDPFIHTLSTARSPLRGAPKQQLHNDSRFPNAPWPLVAVVLYCLEDFREENGATRVVPKSHRFPTFPENNKNYDDEIVLEAPRGSAIIFNGSLWHGSGKNSTNQSRWGMLYSYARWFCKPSFNFNQNMPEEFYHRMTDTQRELFGYKFNPSRDEFERISGRTKSPEKPCPYKLPDW